MRSDISIILVRFWLLLLFTSAAAIHAAAPEWAFPQMPYRVQVTLPADKQQRNQVYAGVSLNVAADMARLGLRTEIDFQSLRLVKIGSSASVPLAIHGGRAEWSAGSIAAGKTQDYHLYFRTNTTGGATSPVACEFAIPDYFTETFGHACDFKHGDQGGITSWGNKPEYIRHKVEDGLLKLDVSDDPYFIWGTMWGPERPQMKPIRINLDTYFLLEVRARQSVPHALWDLYARPVGREHLLHYETTLHGTNWQTLKVDLRRDARWRGTISALRIGPAKHATAHVEIDWIRLTPLQMGTHGSLEILGADMAKVAELEMLASNPNPRVGTEQTLKVRVRDEKRQPVAGQPIRVSLRGESDGVLVSDPATPSLALDNRTRRAISNKDGIAVFRHRVPHRAGIGVEEVVAVAEFTSQPEIKISVVTQPTEPNHYVVTPAQPYVLQPRAPHLAIVAQLADEFGNPLPGEPCKLTWTVDGGKLLSRSDWTSTNGIAHAKFRGLPSRTWVGSVGVQDSRGLAGKSAPISTLPAGPKPNPVRFSQNGYFVEGDKAWMPLGGFYANWVGLPTPDGEWSRVVSFTEATDEQIVSWLTFLKANGVTAQRFMLRTHRKNGMEPMDIGGQVNPALFAKFLHYLDLARPFGFKFLLVLHEDYTKPCYFNQQALEQYCLPFFADMNLNALPAFQQRFIQKRDLLGDITEKYTDPDAMACQDQYARQIISLVKNNPLVFGYELENEMVACPASWANHAMQTVRSVDSHTPICVSHGGGGLHTADPAWWKDKTSIDFYTYHLYPAGSTSPDMDYGIAIDVLTRYGRMGKPAFLGESAGDEFSPSLVDRETRRRTMRDIIWFSLLNGNPGCFFWNARGSEVAEFKVANEMASRVEWSTFQRKAPKVAVAVPHPLDDDAWFRTQAGKDAYAMMGKYSQHYMGRGMDFDFTIQTTSGHQKCVGIEKFESASEVNPEFSVSTGYQLKSLTRHDNSEALLYARNFAGVKLWEQNKPRHWRMYLRERRAAPLKITVQLPGKFRADIWNLDTGEHRKCSLRSGETLDLGTGEHDFAIRLRR